MSDHPRTDARLDSISIENEDSCCAIYIRIDGAEYDGPLVDADFAYQLEDDIKLLNDRLIERRETHEAVCRGLREEILALKRQVKEARSETFLLGNQLEMASDDLTFLDKIRLEYHQLIQDHTGTKCALAIEQTKVGDLTDALKKIANYDDEPIWSDDRDEAADAMLRIARLALGDEEE